MNARVNADGLPFQIAVAGGATIACEARSELVKY